MTPEELKAVFDKQAVSYDKQWLRMAAINNALYFLLESIFADLPANARILCVGVGTGKELIHLAKRFPNWRFTALEPSAAMLAVCRHQVEEAGLSSRCHFHEGYLDSLLTHERYDGATCLLVSQFILAKDARTSFFKQIAARLKPEGILASADLSADLGSETYEALLRLWQSVMAPLDASPERLNQMRLAYVKDVAVLSPEEVALILTSGGFEVPVHFFQAGLIHAWFAKCVSGSLV